MAHLLAFYQLPATVRRGMPEAIPKPITRKRIFLFWAPLAATWLMMAAEWPFLTAVVARLDEPKINLAAWGVALALAILIEAPIIMILSASTALVKDWVSFKKLRNYTYFLNLSLTLTMALIVFTPIFDIIASSLIGLPSNVAALTSGALIILLPWPGAIGYRRFLQGLLIRNDQTRRVAYGTVVRITTMASTAVALKQYSNLHGAYVAATAASAAVTMEAITTRCLAAGAIRKLRETRNLSTPSDAPLTHLGITRFYSPLALTSILALAVHPVIAFFVGNSRLPLESLAVLPVVNALTFLFRSLGLSYQEVGIALLGEKNEHYAALRRFAVLVGIATSACLCALAVTPGAGYWYQHVAGIAPSLTHLALFPTQLLVISPFLEVMLSFQRAVLVNSARTMPVIWATAVEVCILIGALLVTIEGVDVIGATAAAIAVVAGRLAGNLFLIPFTRRARVST
ncbi:MAG: hypothetical protein QNJ97_21015 [Myxococcota bacterium]|nr:hypothetical protein [Myxococcota bacterium]